MRLNTLCALFIMIAFLSCSKTITMVEEEKTALEESTETSMLSQTQRYFLDVALGQEFGSGNSNLKKWTQDISIFVEQSGQVELVEELDSIIHSINTLSKSIQISLTTDKSKANYHIFLSNAETYAAFESNAARYIDGNYGLFWVYWGSNSIIYKGSMYVDIERTTELACQKHLLREELTQSLGLMNDSFEYPESIFQQDWTCTNSYSPEDEKLIQYILDPGLDANMTKEDVINYFLEN